MSKLSAVVSQTLLFLPLFCLPFLPFGFETPKVLVFEFIAIGLFFYLLFTNTLHLSKSLQIGVTGIVLLIVTTLVFFYSATMWFNNPIRLQGLFLQIVLLLWMITSYSQKYIKFSPTLSLLCFTLISISGYFFQHPETGRAIGTLGEPNSYGGMTILLGILTLFSWRNKKFRYIVWGVIFCLSFTAVILSASRSALLAFILFVLLFILWKKKISLSKITITALIFMSCSLCLPFVVRTNSWEDRSMIWQTALVSGFSSPLVGHGFGNITSALQKGAVTLENHIRFQFVDSSHNIILDWWVQGGLLGVTTLVYFVYTSLRIFIKHMMIEEFMVLLLSLFILLFNPASVVTLAIFWWVIGKSFSLEITNSRSRTSLQK